MIDPLPSDIFQPGLVLNNTYEIEGVLGRGGTGEVYLAHNLVSGRIIAIKALNSQFSGNADYVELMKREEQMRDIHHDAVVRYTECSRSDAGHVFLVMDFVDGPAMSDRMAEGPMDARDLMIVAHRVAGGLVAAHGHGIVHRDLSPDNIILRDGSAEQATIIDFGIAKDTAAGARTIVGNDFAGKYEYAAPEQLEGHADARSDLYALGALLLAAFRGEVPFAGATPGEMVRRKQRPLDTSGLPEPLKGLVDWLSDPDPAARPPSAQAVVTRLDALLQPVRKDRKASTPPKRGPRATWLLLPVAAILVAAALYFTDILGPPAPDPLPVATPYRLIATALGNAPPQLTGNAPNAEAAAALRAAFADLAGRSPPEGSLTLADGMPVPGWADGLAAVLAAMRGLEDFTLDAADMEASLTGIASDTVTRDTIAERIEAAAQPSGLSLRLALKAGPRILSVETLSAAIDPLADCGPLLFDRQGGAEYAMGEAVTLSGPVAGTETSANLEAALNRLVGDRPVRLDLSVLNPEICVVRSVLPPEVMAVQDTGLSIWFGYGDSDASNLTGVYRTGENPVVEVHVPATLSADSLWVVIVTNTGSVFNLVPNIDATGHDLASLGTVEGGIRKVRVLYPIADFLADNTKLAMRMSDTDFGKSEVISFLSPEPLFDIRRPRDESVASFAEALETTLDAGADITGLAMRVMDSRP